MTAKPKHTPRLHVIKRRRSLGLSQMDVARRAPCGISAISNLERGVTQRGSVAVLDRIARVLRWTVGDIDRFDRFAEYAADAVKGKVRKAEVRNVKEEARVLAEIEAKRKSRLGDRSSRKG